ncbi:unnamed protein product [Allacma fusca]|uniref:Uncharacterized protein n=1 Tax=Allacma fusca TaxID=39272 RepID=A0A8J2Q5X8_9HEXA|nr:unnamed protein product [Allacma fusca]
MKLNNEKVIAEFIKYCFKISRAQEGMVHQGLKKTVLRSVPNFVVTNSSNRVPEVSKISVVTSANSKGISSSPSVNLNEGMEETVHRSDVSRAVNNENGPSKSCTTILVQGTYSGGFTGLEVHGLVHPLDHTK